MCACRPFFGSMEETSETEVVSGYQRTSRHFSCSPTFCNVAFILGRIEKKRIIEKDLELLLNCLKIAPNDASQLGKALYFQSPDYEDSIQYASAVETKCTYLVTSNVKHFRNARIQVLNPDEAVKVLTLGVRG